jgi:phosphatidylserine/phosphatidylglycerophosphate/cardiolipin synthase-like enzyme
MKKTIIAVALLIILTGCQQIVKEESSLPQVYFNPENTLSRILLQELNESNQSIDCALYDLNIDGIERLLDEKNQKIKIRIVMDDENAINKNYVRKDSDGLMHNKFCVLDGSTTITGSYNPTQDKNNDNMIIIDSKEISKIYEDEFEEMWKGTFKAGKRNYKTVLLNNNTYKIFFCPEDSCEDNIIKEIKNAKKEIRFMVFSFTSQNIADELIKKKNEGLTISGLWEEKRTEMKYEKFHYLEDNGISIAKDVNSADMHNKVFIIDEKTVITGSYNPTNNGNRNNDENMIIIEDKDIAEKYIKEFERLTNITY